MQVIIYLFLLKTEMIYAGNALNAPIIKAPAIRLK